MIRLLGNALALLLLCIFPSVAAQKDRLTIPIDGRRLVTLPDHSRRLATAYVDEGMLEPSRQMDGLTLYMKPSATQKTALDQLLIDLQDPASPRYHQWLTPEEYADRFAITSSDAASIAAWLKAQGFQIGWVGRGRSVIVFNGKAGTVETAFHPEIHRYRSGETVHYANSRNPSVPAALADLVRAIGGLDDFIPVSNGQLLPRWNNPAGAHYLAPGDLATIYDFAPLLAQGIDGTGQKMGIVGTTSLIMSDIQGYNTEFGLSAPNVQSVLVPGYPDPGQNLGSLGEADLDIEVSGAVAPNATIVYVYSTNVFNAITYLIDQALAPTVSSSFSAGCEANTGASTLLAYQALAQQGNAEGITWLTGAGDNGPAECDVKGAPIAKGGLSVKVPAGVPEITVTGGTDFNDQGGTYWASTNGATGGSALSYIPEVVWNSSTSTGIATTGGGVSTFFAKPSWQVGPGVPNDGKRDLPDLAFHASVHEGYKVVVNGATNIVSGGDSATGPLLSGMLALLNQFLVANGVQAKPGLGNINPMLYRVAQSNPSAFHDIVSGNNIVSCTAGTPGCVNGQMGYSAGPGYDLCTGLGTLDFANFAAALLPTPPASMVVASGSPNPVLQTVDSNGVSSWNLSLTLTNETDVPTTLTGFAIDGNAQQVSSYFPTQGIGASSSVQSANVSLADAVIPQTHVFSFTGADANGRSWTASVSIPFLGQAPSPNGVVPVIAGMTNGASFQQAYAPGMILDIFGSNLAGGTQLAASVPLSTYMQSFEATVNGVLAPLYYVSPTQANVQIPYGTAPGAASMVIYQAGQSTTSEIEIVAAAPGIFTDGNGNTVPYASGSAGQTLTLFITGDGEISPALATGSAPATSIPVSSLPKSNLPVSMTIGNRPAQIVFDGIPYGLVGVTQINFVVPAGLAPGPQPVVITVGTASSKAAMFTIVAGS